MFMNKLFIPNCRAVRVRKVLGGGLHQAGMFAAAGLYALEHVAPRLAWDHTHARAIAQGIPLAALATH